MQYRETKGWGAPKRWALRDGQISPNALGTGDLTGDGRTDLLLLGESKLYVLYQDAKGALGKPVTLPLAGGAAGVPMDATDTPIFYRCKAG